MSRTHSSTAEVDPSRDSALFAALCRSESYPGRVAASLAQPLPAQPSPSEPSPVVVHETHVSWVFLVGEYAYKVKKPITTHFLDYGSLAKREHFCHQEYRLNRRYAPDLYLGVVPIAGTRDKSNAKWEVEVEGDGTPIEFAVKMQRFPEDALLSRRLQMGKLAVAEVRQLAETVAEFHQHAARVSPDKPWGAAESILGDALDNFADLRAEIDVTLSPELDSSLKWLESWTERTYQQNLATLERRPSEGFVRECHGDLHLANVIRWHERWTPFDGIEFNDAFRWIDVLCDAAFLAMDFAAQGHLDLARSFISAYLAQTGDYSAVPLLRWYLVYRALVRAKVAALRCSQPAQSKQAQQAERQECIAHVELACQLAKRSPPRLWITHGVSGSGKTIGSEGIIQVYGAVRLRSDVERKRLFGLRPSERPSGPMQTRVYGHEATEQTYEQLRRMAERLLRGGDSVVVDATFLHRRYRDMFRELAEQLGTPFGILHFTAEPQELEQRIADRIARDRDASDADLEVLRQQLTAIEPLTTEELSSVVKPLTP